MQQPPAGRKTPKHRNVRLQNISLQPTEHAALAVLATRLSRGNKSAFVASLIVKAAKEEIGRDWETVVTTVEEDAAA